MTRYRYVTTELDDQRRVREKFTTVIKRSLDSQK